MLDCVGTWVRAGREAKGILDGEGERPVGAVDECLEILLQAEPGAVEEGADELEKPGGGPQLRWHGQGVESRRGRR